MVEGTYDFVVVGAGIFGATVAERLARQGQKVLVLERRDHLAGNIFSRTDPETKIEIHQYGSHIFHTKSQKVWDYLNRFTEFNNYIHTVNTRHHGKLYPMPINLDTINLLYRRNFSAAQAEEFVAREAKKTGINNPRNFEEKGLSLVGEKLYNAFLKNYTKKQWNVDPKTLSAKLLSRIPVRFSHDNRYFIDAKFQGIPKNGYTKMVEKMLNSKLIKVKLNTNFDLKLLKQLPETTKIIYCGQIDELLDYKFGVLPYRSLRFEEERTEKSLGQAVINEADLNVSYTRAHDYKFYQIHAPEIINQKTSIICREYPADFKKGGEAYYPVNSPDSAKLYQKYKTEAVQNFPNLLLGGRLGAFCYWDMDTAVEKALALTESLGKI